MVYSYNPSGAWTGQHQMSINGKRDNFLLDDLLALGSAADIKAKQAKAIIAEVVSAVAQWRGFADRAGVNQQTAESIRNAHRRFDLLNSFVWRF